MPREPPVKAPVVKVTFPRFPVSGLELPFQPTMAIKVDPVSISSAFDPDNAPPPLLKSTEVVADAKVVRPIKESKTKLMTPSFAEFIYESSLAVDGFQPWLVV